MKGARLTSERRLPTGCDRSFRDSTEMEFMEGAHLKRELSPSSLFSDILVRQAFGDGAVSSPEPRSNLTGGAKSVSVIAPRWHHCSRSRPSPSPGGSSGGWTGDCGGGFRPRTCSRRCTLPPEHRLEHYGKIKDLPFGVWIRLLAGQRLVEAHRRHFGAMSRDRSREVSLDAGSGSAVLAARLAGDFTTPSRAAIRHETVELLTHASMRSIPSTAKCSGCATSRS